MSTLGAFSKYCMCLYLRCRSKYFLLQGRPRARLVLPRKTVEVLVLVHRVQLLRGGRAARRHRRGEQPLLRAPGGAVAAVDVVVRDLHGGEVREPVVVFSNVDYDYSIHTIRTIWANLVPLIFRDPPLISKRLLRNQRRC